MDMKDVMEVSFVAKGGSMFGGKIIIKCAEDGIATIEMEKIKIDSLDFVRTEIPYMTNNFMFQCLRGYEDKINLFAKNVGKESITFSELIDYLTTKNQDLSEAVKKMRIEKSNTIRESEKQNRKYKKTINSLQKTIGRLLDIYK